MIVSSACSQGETQIYRYVLLLSFKGDGRLDNVLIFFTYFIQISFLSRLEQIYFWDVIGIYHNHFIANLNRCELFYNSVQIISPLVVFSHGICIFVLPCVFLLWCSDVLRIR